ncbi:hypothetical protein HK097_001957 [Rhizophlyctis rosea]|uniref:UDP-glucose 4-epimerase n=1 Tax=Rhizophlyctis rosea TaxID=64517 RepID=A0AAD5X0H8_9FUNG|nr:hypothetical protein HK097_001957 [Rhizophlyctis rosea]
MPTETPKTIFVTGGAGYIGSHTVLELLQESYSVIVLDNLSNSSPESLSRICALLQKPITFYQGSLSKSQLLDKIFTTHKVWAVIHFAALKSAPESVEKPLDYWGVNVGGTMGLLEAMRRHGVGRLVFSSTAAVYGTPVDPTSLIPETHQTVPMNPYGRSKLAVEHLIRDLCTTTPSFGAVILRYFNPVGAHKSGKIGEDPKGQPGNLVPFVLEVVSGKRKRIDITGTDWETRDGSGVRDFIHVVDLAKGHVASLERADFLASSSSSTTTTSSPTTSPIPNYEIYNMGSGLGTSVLEIIKTMSAVTSRPIDHVAAPRRAGDVAQVVADPARANKILGWRAEMTVKDMCEDAWRFKEANPEGYTSVWEGDSSGVLGVDGRLERF